MLFLTKQTFEEYLEKRKNVGSVPNIPKASKIRFKYPTNIYQIVLKVIG